jgi:2'-5' RNA ligase
LGWKLRPEEATALHTWAQNQLDGLPIRLIPPEDLHVTLLFFANVTAAQRDELTGVVNRIEWTRAEASLGSACLFRHSAIAFPLDLEPKRREELEFRVTGSYTMPLSIAAAMDSEERLRLQAEMAERQGAFGELASYLERAELVRIWRRTFLNLHVTVARTKRHAESTGLPTTSPAMTVHLDRLALFESTLSPNGATYEILATSVEV